MLLGYLLLALVVAAVLFYAVVALLPAGLSVPPQRDERPFELPADRRMRSDDLDRLRIPVSVRGYRFAETDDLIDRLAAEIVVRDEEIARLRSDPHRPSASDPGAERSDGPSELRPSASDPGAERSDGSGPHRPTPGDAVPEADEAAQDD